MRSRHCGRQAILLAMLLAISGPARPLWAAPWDTLLSFKRIEADESKPYRLTEDQGPWLIMATSFAGEDAEQQAHDLAIELRKRYKLPAFVHPMNFDLDGAQGRGVDARGRPKKMRYQRGTQLKEIAVMIGDYTSVDDPDAQRDLKKLHQMQPECLKTTEGKKTSRPLASLRFMQQQVAPMFLDDKKSTVVESVKRGRGPLGNAFVTTNPILPKDFFVPQGLDPLVVRMNKDAEFSLLDCPGRYSVIVATFKGSMVIDPKKVEAIEQGKAKFPTQLEEAAEKAHKLAKALVAKGEKAYEFHDRNASIVCVGSFDSIGKRHPDGRIDLNPSVNHVMEKFGAPKKTKPGQAQPEIGAPRTIEGITLDIQPMPIEVPRRSVSADYARTPGE